MLLTSNTQRLQMVTGSVGSIDVTTDYMDNNAGVVTPGDNIIATVSTAATTDIVPAPGSGIQRNITLVVIHNSHATVANAITVQRYDGTNAPKLFTYTLQPAETLCYIYDLGWQAFDANGNLKTTGIGTGRLVKETVYTTGTAQPHTFQSGISRVEIELIGAGGGGGGAAFSSPNGGYGAGGASGAYVYQALTGNLPATGTYTVGAGGTAGANTGGTGGTGGDTTMTVSGTTYTAKGGLGGVGQAAGAGLGAAAGGAGQAGSTVGTYTIPSEPGENSVRLSGTVGASGSGGNGQKGAGGAASTAQAAGAAGAGMGGGAGGAAVVSASAVGGVGAAGGIIIREYS